MILAWGIGLLGTMQIGWVSGEGMTTRLWVTAGVVGGLALAAHITIRIFARYADQLAVYGTAKLARFAVQYRDYARQEAVMFCEQRIDVVMF